MGLDCDHTLLGHILPTAESTLTVDFPSNFQNAHLYYKVINFCMYLVNKFGIPQLVQFLILWVGLGRGESSYWIYQLTTSY